MPPQTPATTNDVTPSRNGVPDWLYQRFWPYGRRETRQTVQETIDVCGKVRLKPELFFFTTAYAATRFRGLALEKGLIEKTVTGERGPADDDIIEQYFLGLGEQGQEVRTNLSYLPNKEIVEPFWWAVRALGTQNTVRHLHTGEAQKSSGVRGVTRAAV